MSIDITSSGDVTVFSPIGRMDSANSGQVEGAVVGHIDNGGKFIVIDFDRLDYISSAGLRVVLMAAKKVRPSGGRMALCNLKPHIREIFEMSGFLSILTVCDSREQAVQTVAG